MIMEDGAFTPNNNNNNNNSFSIDFNLMDELLYDGFWLETTTTTTTSTEDGSSNFWQSQENLNPTSFFFPTSDDTTSTNTNPPQPQSQSQQSFLNPQTDADSSSKEHEAQITHQQLDIIPASVSDVNRRLWVGPNKNPTVKKRLLQAINQLKDSIRDKDVLIQIWVPVKRGGKQVLTTNNQPFSLNPSCKNLADYRDASRTYQFAADKDSKENVQGLPGRVFLKKLPEWTPDVRFFKSEEYPRVAHAQQYDVRGSLALPVFEQASGNCLGVVEIVTTTQKVDYRPELETVCKALEAVDLKSSNVPSPPNVEQNCNEPYQAALAEIRNMLKCVCDTHNLPLAQTWAPCIQQGKGGCRHSDENYAHCVSTVDSACYVADTQVSGFHEACSEHHLLKGEGIAGKAFWTNQPCFSQDIKAFRKTEYPLAHHAAVFNLCAAVAIRLRSIYTGKADFVLEFFLPLNYKDEKDQRLILLDSLSSVIEQTCQSLRVVTDQELTQETSKGDDSSSSSSSSSWITHMMMDPKQKGKGVTVSLGGKQHKVEPEEEFKVTTTQWDNNSGLDLDENFSLAASGHLSLASAKRSSEKRRAKTEKAIGLEVLRQYFAGSLKDAARSIGVCPTTLKRICRHHGITRWPSRKIKKVGHSLKKLQLVIDSVQGAEGSIQLSSFYNNFPELVSPPNVAPGSSHSPTSKIIGHLPEKSPSSSDSHSSSSSYCVSTGVKQSSDFPVNGDALSEEQTKGGGGGGGMLKRARSDAELHDLGQEETKQQLLVRSYSHKIFSTQNTNAPVVPKSNTTNVETFRVKATFGEEKIRLSMQPNWDFKNLQQEVLRRFNIDIGIRMDLKYLDDDAEWVLLTCDDDLEECIDIHRSCKSRTIKISVNQASSYHPSLGSSFCSNGPF